MNPRAPVHHTLQLWAASHFDDLIGTNLQHAVENFVWEEWRPITADGKTIADFWNLAAAPALPPGYTLDESGAFVIRQAGVPCGGCR